MTYEQACKHLECHPANLERARRMAEFTLRYATGSTPLRLKVAAKVILAK